MVTLKIFCLVTPFNIVISRCCQLVDVDVDVDVDVNVDVDVDVDGDVDVDVDEDGDLPDLSLQL